MVLVDSNVLLDLIKEDPVWINWSLAMLEAAALDGALLINPIIYAELSIGYPTIEALEEFTTGTGLRMAEIPKEALFLAGKAFASYRRLAGSKTGVLPDFFIGAHATVSGLPILTRDVGRYRTYFPAVQLLTPEQKA
ncbi:type II toxin-antitoxin system VapC family toxin [Rhizobium sp. LjRoot254]|uniref:type II toxin-antitoxin system VapC family toxin n=1 Tax=Rhizobium sp. LjRoot254 TaxID=3342297 RepID=UPI003ED0259A